MDTASNTSHLPTRRGAAEDSAPLARAHHVGDARPQNGGLTILPPVAGYKIFRGDELEFAQPSGGNQGRGIVRLSDALREMRANIWRLPQGVRGRRHSELVQEELFVVLEGTATLRLGDPAEPVELPRGSVALVEPQTAVQLVNEGDEDTVVLIVGAPPVQDEVEYLPDA